MQRREVDWMLICSIVAIFASSTAFWVQVELKEALKNPARPGWSANTLTPAIVIVWAFARAILEFLQTTSWNAGNAYRNLSAEAQIKAVVHLLELVWGTFLFLVLLFLAIRINISEEPDCTAEYLGISQRLQQTTCVQSKDAPKATADGYLLVLPGTRVQHLEEEDVEVLQRLRNECHLQNAFAVEAAFVGLIALYVFEICFEGSHMRPSLLLHHLAAIGVIFAAVGLPLSTLHFACVYVHVWFATMEQPTFFFLVVYRLFPEMLKLQMVSSYVAWIFFGTTKLTAHAVSIFLLVSNLDEASTSFVVIFVVLTILGGLTQLYSTYAQFLIWKKSKKRFLASVRTASEKDSQRSSMQDSSSSTPSELDERSVSIS